ncbi:GPI mannosyltransferase [Penicillium odoratum]|uniref:GPI mannosyltransferase n=1 Tax=Penicillium odoratum TaxID=1167516 RepID=UPI0025494D63|nr:GPI mannosyltransferase [Penicillium odoratum]KAJ5759090.1 GPI mannosyltransferase [Penicillium odoratum]
MPHANTSTPRRVASAPTVHILLYLIAFRLANALAVRTFFQPDEFFQSLEPAWQIAFGTNQGGKEQGAWLTWEWEHRLRSSLHPLLFAAIYKATDSIASVLCIPSTRAELLIAAPKFAQAVLSALGDFYTWRLASRIYGEDSRGAWAALIATILNPWQWFCSTRTLSNCLETTLTIVALDQWPWQWLAGLPAGDNRKYAGERVKAQDRQVLLNLRQCLSLAAVACILRPTNIIIWMTLAGLAWLRISSVQRTILVREILLCGSAILGASAVADRLFYGIWTFPPLRFLYFNIAQSLAVFYGRNNWHYYMTEGYPLLLTTLLPFAVPGLYLTLTTRFSASSASERIRAVTRLHLATICILMPFILSLISHKEVRFIYPLLPSLHILAAPRLVQFFWPALTFSSQTPRRLALIFLILVNGVIAIYTSVYHASGPLKVLGYLRGQYEAHSEPDLNVFGHDTTITAGFLMPCHSTPWRSHMVHPINAWALSCEPPVDLSDTQKAIYRDEADQFYDDPAHFLQKNMAGGLRYLPRQPSYISGFQPRSPGLHQWPDYLIFFAQLEPTMHSLVRGSYAECWRTWSTSWHDDWRRRGDIVVWCLDPAEQDAWRSQKEASHEQSHWLASVPGSLPSFSSLRTFFESHFSSTRWPWSKRSRLETLLSNFRQSPSWHDWIPHRPEWLGGPSKRTVDKREHGLWE